MRRTGRLRQFSTHRAAKQRARVEMLRRTTHGPQRCQWPGGCTNEAVDPHEVRTRARGGSITDGENIRLLCRTHHDWIGDHPREAAGMGLLASGQVARVRHDRYDQAVSDTPAPKSTHQPKVALRLSQAGIDYADQLATETGRSRSDVLRAMFSIATTHRDDVVTRLTAEVGT